jgi:hypothetical protein
MRRVLMLVVLVVAGAGAAEPLESHVLAYFTAQSPQAQQREIGVLRAAGPPGLAAVDATCRRQLPELRDVRWDDLYDAVGGQRGCRASQLYWYTDLAAAEAAAVASGRPIVSLRLLGKLTDEYSCANSRFFRAILYSDAEVADWLRSHVILHWSSERPVPQVAIDYGDGRVLRTTIGGNSAHLVLDAEGRVIDVLPGLYGPKPFITCLATAVELERKLRDDPHRQQTLCEWHQRYVAAAGTRRRFISASLPASATGERIRVPLGGSAMGGANAADVETLTVSKSGAEIALARDLVWGDPERPRSRLVVVPTPDTAWGQLGAGGREQVAGQLGRLRALLGADAPATDVLIAAVEDSLAKDTALDEFVLHADIHQQFGTGEHDFDATVRWLYDELFATPAADPWLGLLSHVYDGLDHRDVADARPGK